MEKFIEMFLIIERLKKEIKDSEIIRFWGLENIRNSRLESNFLNF